MPQNNTLRSQTQTQVSGRDKSSPSGLRAAREILLLCTTANISPGRKERISQILAGTVDWKYLLELAEFHGVAPLISYNLVTNGLASQIPQSYLERLNRIYYGTLYRNVILSNELTKVLSLFRQHGVGAIALKGTILAEQLYRNPALRTTVDMDILVKTAELSRASSLLLEMGYQKFTRQKAWDHPFHEVYYKHVQFPFFIELHWNLDAPKLVAVPQQDIWHRAQLLQIQGETTMVLSPEDTLLYLSNNLFKPSAHRLRSLCDIAELIKKFDGVLDWDYIIESTHSWGVETSVYYSLRLAKDLLGAPVTVSPIKALRPGAWRRWLLDFLVSQEVFISTTRLTKLRAETCTIVRGLMMKHSRQTLAVLSRYRGYGKRVAWLRTVFWVMLVFSAALGRNMARVASGWRW